LSSYKFGGVHILLIICNFIVLKLTRLHVSKQHAPKRSQISPNIMLHIRHKTHLLYVDNRTIKPVVFHNITQTCSVTMQALTQRRWLGGSKWHEPVKLAAEQCQQVSEKDHCGTLTCTHLWSPASPVVLSLTMISLTINQASWKHLHTQQLKFAQKPRYEQSDIMLM